MLEEIEIVPVACTRVFINGSNKCHTFSNRNLSFCRIWIPLMFLLSRLWGIFCNYLEESSRESERERHVLLFICSQSLVYFLSSTKSLSRFIKDIFLLSFHIDATPSQNLISFDTSFVFQSKMIMENASRNTQWTNNIYIHMSEIFRCAATYSFQYAIKAISSYKEYNFVQEMIRHQKIKDSLRICSNVTK